MNENSKVLALKYRPKTFNDLIGQNVVAETIINSIKANKTPNAYLFTGIRGVGKTTIARIVAKSLNCLNGIEKLCTEKLCNNCEAITNSSHIDVLELNGADKTSINDIRDLIELSRYRPTSSKFKIFCLGVLIIKDESIYPNFIILIFMSSVMSVYLFSGISITS